jgi:hypothetical protein
MLLWTLRCKYSFMDLIFRIASYFNDFKNFKASVYIKYTNTAYFVV